MFAEPLRQVTPAPARPRHPQQRIQKSTVIRTRPALALRPAGNQPLDTLPLIVPQRVAIHRRSPKISVESDLRPLGSPRSLNCHHGLAGSDLDVVIGGLGLGYTAQAVLEHKAVRSLVIVEVFDAVIDWHEKGILPLGPALTADPRSRLVLGDFFALAASKKGFDPLTPARRFDAILVDIDHSPDCLLSNRRTRPFISPRGYKGSPHIFFLAASSGFGLMKFRTRRSYSGLPRSSPWHAPSGSRFITLFKTANSLRPFISLGRKVRQNCKRSNDGGQSAHNLGWFCVYFVDRSHVGR